MHQDERSAPQPRSALCPAPRPPLVPPPCVPVPPSGKALIPLLLSGHELPFLFRVLRVLPHRNKQE